MTRIIILISVFMFTLPLRSEQKESPDTISRQLKEVVVVAKENKGITTSSRIDREAMEHLQPSSFTDILELLPGNVSQDPKLGQVNSISLREAGNLSATGSRTQNDDYAITSLGTQFMIDGSPLNTDANLQSIAGTDVSDPTNRLTSVNRGVDMRAISTDNIESVEIVRGIPSAEYGNLTSGLVNIKRIKRATPFTFRFKADEYSKLFAAGKGFGIPSHNHTINIDLSYLDSKTDPRVIQDNYRRITSSILPTFRFRVNDLSVKWGLGVDYTGSFDRTKKDPDLNMNKIDEFRRDFNRYALTSTLSISFSDIDWLRNVELNASASYENDILHRKKQVAPARASVAPSGFEEGDHNVSLLLGEYIADYKVDGKPFAATIKLKGNGTASFSNATNNYKGGVEWNLSKNYGKGEVYDLDKPLSGAWSTRPRAFRDIPAMHLLSWFLEDDLTTSFGSNDVELQLGLRGMTMPLPDNRYYLSKRVYLDPRMNACWNFPIIDAHMPLRFFLSAGWGKTTRMPTLDYLYPQCHYNDIIQLNYYDPADPVNNSLVNVRTYKVEAVNHDLKAATNMKWEVRIGGSWGANEWSVTYFEENMNNGFRYTPVYSSYSYKKYDVGAFDPLNPDLINLPYSEARILDGLRKVTNGTRIKKRGIEYTLHTARLAPLRTALTVNGAWFKSAYSNSQALYSPVNDVVGNQPVSDRFVGIYDTTDGRVNEQFNTNFMFDTQLPQWGLVFTTSIQCMWYVKTTRMAENGVPVSYICADDGEIHPFNQDNDPLLKYLVKTYNEDSFRTVKIPTAIFLNLKVSKKIGKWLRLSAFANRIIDYLPDYNSNGLTVRRYSDAYFGMEATITI